MNMSMENAPKYTSKQGHNPSQHTVNKNKGLLSSFWQNMKPLENGNVFLPAASWDTLQNYEKKHGHVLIFVAATGPLGHKNQTTKR